MACGKDAAPEPQHVFDGGITNQDAGVDQGVPWSAKDAADIATPDIATADVEEEDVVVPPPGYQVLHVRYPWDDAQALRLEDLPAQIDFKIEFLCNSVLCSLDRTRPWYTCLVPDTFFVPEAGWVIEVGSTTPPLSTLVQRPMPTEPREYWLYRVGGEMESAMFEFLDRQPGTGSPGGIGQ